MFNCPHCRQDLTPHQIGVLHASVARTENRTSRHYWGAKLTELDASRIRKSKETNWTLAQKHNVSFSTITRTRNNQTHKAPIELKCPHCDHKLTANVINKLFAALGGSATSPKRKAAAIARGRKMSKLTDEDIANIQKSTASNRELARQHKVLLATIRRVRRTKP